MWGNLMPANEHTPGPWGWEHDDGSMITLQGADHPDHGNPQTVLWTSRCRACMERGNDCACPRPADARLIATAPEMLAVLERVERSMRSAQWEKVEDVRADIRAIIAKATGQGVGS